MKIDFDKATKLQTLSITIIVTLLMISLFAFSNFLIQRKNSRVIRIGYIYEGDASMPCTENFMRTRRDVELAFGDRVKSIEFFNVKSNKLDALYNDVVEANCDIVFSSSYGFCKTIKKWAKLLPETQFCAASGDNANAGVVFDNYHTYMGTIYQGRYVTGVAAGLKLKELIDKKLIKPNEAKIGYVAAFPYAEVISGYTAFFMGVRSQVPTVTMDVIYTDAWSNYTKEKEYAKKLIKGGCVIISQHSDTTGPAVACQEMSVNQLVFHVGYNGSMTDVAPTTSLLSCKINWTPYALAAVDAVMRGKKIESCVKGNIRGNDAWAGFDKGWVEILDINDYIVAPDTRKVVQKTIKAMKKNKIDVFSGNYTGTHPSIPSDKIDLSKTSFKENASDSSPSFRFVLDDLIRVVK